MSPGPPLVEFGANAGNSLPVAGSRVAASKHGSPLARSLYLPVHRYRFSLVTRGVIYQERALFAPLHRKRLHQNRRRNPNRLPSIHQFLDYIWRQLGELKQPPDVAPVQFRPRRHHIDRGMFAAVEHAPVTVNDNAVDVVVDESWLTTEGSGEQFRVNPCEAATERQNRYEWTGQPDRGGQEFSSCR
jgi:hypothetical protein